MQNEFLWVEKYRPQTVRNTILPVELKSTFQQFVDQKNVPNLLLTGRAGVGKTTVAKAMLEEIGADYITINGSMNGNIDTLRNEISNFASSISFTGGRKYVILDEADYLNANSTHLLCVTLWKSSRTTVVSFLLVTSRTVLSNHFTLVVALLSLLFQMLRSQRWPHCSSNAPVVFLMVKVSHMIKSL